MIQDREGNFWFGTRGEGVSRYDPYADSETSAWTTFTTEDGLASDTVYSIIQDRDGRLWFGTPGGSLAVMILRQAQDRLSGRLSPQKMDWPAM